MMEDKQKKEIRNINSELPYAAMEVIFSKLPIINLWSCRLVCKEWNDVITNCKFGSPISISNLLFVHRSSNVLVVDSDPNHLESLSTVATFKFDPRLSSGDRSISIINSCNGILCVLIKNSCRKGVITRGDAWIVNTVTNEHLKLPISKADRMRKYLYGYGLGLNPRTQQYKIARTSRVFDRSGTLVEISAMGSNLEWIQVKFLSLFFPVCNHVYFDGGIYMVGRRNNEKKRHVIYRLDVENERMRKISFPKNHRGFCHIGEVNGMLYVTTHNHTLLHVLMMREDYSWVIVTAFPFASLESFDFKLIKTYEYGKFLFLFKKLELLLYDSKSRMIMGIGMDQGSELKEMESLSFHRVCSINFNSLDKILAGNSWGLF